VRSRAWRIVDQPGQEILDAALPIQLPEQGDGVGAVEPGSEDEQAKGAPKDSPTGEGCVGDREISFFEVGDRRKAVNEAGPFFSYSWRLSSRTVL
jgi:hypothetical protein